MADNDPSLTPEKRLLQLIEGGRGENAAKAATTVRKNDFMLKFKQVLTPEGIKNLVTETRASCVNAFKNRQDFINLRGANKAGKIFAVLLCLYLAFKMFYEIQVVNGNYVSSLKEPAKEMTDIKLTDKRIFDTNLLKQVDKLNIFVPYDKRQKAEVKPEDENLMSLKLVTLIKDWKLAGISYYAENPEKTFCMVEDLQKSTTTFLKVGDSFSGLQVSKINPDSVIFRFNEETIELR